MQLSAQYDDGKKLTRAKLAAVIPYANVTDPGYGAVGDGATVNTSAVQAAIDAVDAAGGGTVFFPPGTFLFDDQVNVPDKVYLLGSGMGITVLTWDGAGGSFPDNACISALGSLTAIDVPDADVDKNDFTVEFGAAQPLVEDDVFVIRDTTSSSFNPERPYYYAGEFFHIYELSGNDVIVDRPAYDTYLTTDSLEAHRLDALKVGVANMTIVGPGLSDIVACVRFDLCRDSYMKDLELSGTQYGTMVVSRSWNCRVRDCNVFDAGPNESLNYGVVVSNSQRVYVDRCHMTVRRHGVTLGGADTDAAVPCREVRVSNCVLSTRSLFAVNAHGNSEDYWFADCQLNGGAQLSGDFGRLTRCNLTNEADAIGRALLFSETIGANFTVSDCDIHQVAPTTSGIPRLIDWGANATYAIVLPERAGGGFTFDNVRVNATDVDNVAIFRNRGTVSDVHFSLSNCRIIRDEDSNVSPYWQIRGDTAYWRTIRINNTKMIGCAPRLFDHGAEVVMIDNLEVRGSPTYGMQLLNSDAAANFPWGGTDGMQRYMITNCVVHDCEYAGIYIQGWDQTIAQCKINNCDLTRNGNGNAGSSDLDGSYYVLDFKFADTRGNNVSDDRAAPSQVRAVNYRNVTFLLDNDSYVVGGPSSVNENNVTQRVTSVEGVRPQKQMFTAHRTASPAAGTWNVGDIVWNTEPSVGNPIGWMCTVAGTPGTWVALANL